MASAFIWYDLMTPDLKSATAFYGDVVGWRIADSGMPGMNYMILNAGDVMVGGLMQRPPEMGDSMPGWQGHVYVPDVDDYAERVKAAGGKVHRPPADIPGIGRFAVVADPGGAAFILFKPNTDQSPAKIAMGTPGQIGWRELHARDLDQAWSFYAKLLGWEKSEAMTMPGGAVYQMFTTGSPEMAGGMMTMMPGTPRPHWVYYFNVPSIDAAVARIKKNGGTIAMEPMQVPGGQWALNARDGQGQLFGLLGPK
jgi:uncharacterized protein